MRRVFGVLVVLAAIAGALLLLDDGDRSADPLSPEALDREGAAGDDFTDPLPGYVEPTPPVAPPVPPPEPATPRLEGTRASFLFVRVVDQEGAPVPRAWVHVEVGQGEDWREHVEETENGVAKIPSPAPDERMHVAVTQPRGADGRPLNLLERRVEDLAVDAAEVVVALEPARSLRGRTIDDEGRPVAGVTVLAALVKRMSSAQEARTDADGAFVIRALPTGPLEVRVRRSDAWLPLRDVQVPADVDDVELVLHRRRELVVRVVDAGGKPVAGAQVSVTWIWADLGWDQKGRTDASGRFGVRDACATARYHVHVRAHDATPAVPDLRLHDQAYGEGTIVAQAAAPVEIRGRMLDAQRRTVANGYVTVRGTDGDTLHIQATAHLEEGRFVIGRLVPGTYKLHAEPFADRSAKPIVHYGHVTPFEVVAPAGDVRVLAPPAVSARGTVIGSDLHQVRVDWHAPGAWSRSSGVFRTGGFAINLLADEPGNLYASRRTDGACCLLENVRPSDGPFEMRLAEGGEIRGTLEGFAARKLYVNVVLVRGPTRLGATVDRLRTFRRRSLPPGPWRIEVTRNNGEVLVAIDGVETGAQGVVLMAPP